MTFAAAFRDGRQAQRRDPRRLLGSDSSSRRNRRPMDFDSLAAKGTLLGSCGCMVIDESVCMVRLAMRTARFYAEETCGQCSQCREGTWWMEQVLHRIEHGQGKMADLDMILDMCSNMKGVTICVLSDACAMPVEAMINKYRDEFEYHITNKKCMVGADEHSEYESIRDAHMHEAETDRRNPYGFGAGGGASVLHRRIENPFGHEFRRRTACSPRATAAERNRCPAAQIEFLSLRHL